MRHRAASIMETASLREPDCWMGRQIRPVGWNDWRNPANQKTLWFGEFDSSGPGADARR